MRLHPILLSGELTRLRAYQPADRALYVHWMLEPAQWAEQAAEPPGDLSVESAGAEFDRRANAAGAQSFWMITRQADHMPAGLALLSSVGQVPGDVEIGLELQPPFRRQGLAREAVQLLLSYAGQVGVTRVLAFVHARNSASRQLFTAAGFHLDGTVSDGQTTLDRFVCVLNERP